MATPVQIQRSITILALVLLGVKLIAWSMTKSVAIFTDAMESIVNVAAGFLGWYSVWLSAKPRDKNHPYGHGKVEFVSAAVEGTLIMVAGVIILYEGFLHLRNPVEIKSLNAGLLLLVLTAILNYIAGTYAHRSAMKNHSMALEAAGNHLRTDTFSTIGIIIGLGIMWLTGWYWLDLVIAFLVAGFIFYTGYKVLRKSLAGIMDEADLILLEKLIAFLEANRYAHPSWIDIHNLRMVQYGRILHLDGHITLPWYFTVKEAHFEIEELNNLIHQEFGNIIELFLHVDYCEDFCCRICAMKNCAVRQHPHHKYIPWTVENVLQNQKHNKK